MTRHNTEALKHMLHEHIKSTLAPFMSRFGFMQSGDHTFTKGNKLLQVEPSSYNALELPWILTAYIGIKDEWEKQVLSKNRMPYHTGTTEETARSIKRLTDDLEENWIEFLGENT